jgi:hypothetical protein
MNSGVRHPWGFWRSLTPIGINQHLFGHEESPFCGSQLSLSTCRMKSF